MQPGSDTPARRSTRPSGCFGDYIDRYTMRRSMQDGVTLQIVYEGRTHKAEVSDRAAMDTAFEDVFSDYDLQERLRILGYGSRDAYLEAESTIEAKARGHGRPLPDPRVPERLQGAGGRHVARSGRALQGRTSTRRSEPPSRSWSSGPTSEARTWKRLRAMRHGRGHLRKPQRSAAPEGPYGPVEARGEHQELQAALRRRRRRA